MTPTPDEKRRAVLETIAEAANGEEVWKGIVAAGLPDKWKSPEGEVQDANVQVDLFRSIKLEALKELKAQTPVSEPEPPGPNLLKEGEEGVPKDEDS